MTTRLSRRDILRAGLRMSAAMAIANIPGCGDGEAEDAADGGDGGKVAPGKDGGIVDTDASQAMDAGADAKDGGVVEVFGPRPFYVVGHNPNTIAEVNAALAAGANAIEPDINVYKNNANELCISHGEGDANAPSLVQYLKDLHAVAVAHPELSLIVFDCKPGTVSPQNGMKILSAVRQHLTYDTNLNVIISVSALSSANMFDLIQGSLGPREGVMVDEENDVVAVSDHFDGLGVTNHGYGNGISVLSCGILGPNVRPSMEKACAIRASGRRPRFIYVWTIDCVDLEQEYVRIGVDGVITDDPAEVRSVMAEPEFKNVVRLAVRADNPFTPANFAYALTVKTGDVASAGTDANVTFTLKGSLGSASKTVDTKYIKRMERDDTNYVTIQSPDVGTLQSITVQRDNSGNAPGWNLDYIEVKSARFGVAKRATFNMDIDDTNPHTKPLV
ncbi:MAG: PLAT/LH2 domain-containing protein [Polyangiaceae bacterium]